MSPTIDIQQKRIDFFLRSIKNQKNCRVLDIGCQTGSVCHQLSKLGHDAYGVEVLEESVSSAREKYPQLHFEVANCEEKIPFANNFFDIVWAGDVIEHIAFTDIFINEINRVLKVKGLFILTTPMHNIVKNIIISLCNFEKHFDPEFPHYRFYTLKSLGNVLKKRGLSIKKTNYIGRIAPLAKTMFIIAEKKEDKQVYSQHRY